MSKADLSPDLILRGLADNPCAMLLLDGAFNVSFANEAALKIWGQGDGAELIGRPVGELLNNAEPLVASLSRDGAWSGELTAVLQDRSRVEFLASANVIEGEDGSNGGYLCMLFDVGGRRDELRRLEHGRQMFSSIGERAKFVVFESTPDTGLYRIVGNTPLLPLATDEDRLEARLDMYPPEERAKLVAAIESIMSGEALPGPIEVKAVFPDGSIHWIRHDGWLDSEPGETPGRMVGWSRDITEEKEALLELERLEERYALAAEFSKTMVFELFPEERKFIASGSVRLMPIADEDWDAESMDARLALFHPDDAEAVRLLGVSIMEGKADTGEIEARVPLSDGSVRWLSLELHVAERPKDGPLRIIGTAHDITERKEAEIALRQSEERYALAAKFARMGAWEIYPEQGKILADRNMSALLGQPDVEPSTDLEVWNDTIYPADRDYVEREMREVIEGRSDSFTIEHRTILADGNIEWRRDNGYVASKPGEPFRIVGTSRDITGQREAEEQLLQAQKMETVGQLSAGVAHDFNNLLAVVLGNIELAMEGLSGNSELRDLLDQALTAGERGAELTRHLLAFSRRQTLYPEVVDLNRVLPDLLQLVERTIGRGIDVLYKPNDSLRQVFVDRAQLESGILNLAVNARDAMPHGGALTIRAYNVTLPSGEDETSPHDDYVCIEVVDTGGGMADETLAQAFQPFFTTKEVGKGSGLGLSMVHGFAEQSGGHVELESTLGQGTTVKLYFPISTGAEKRHQARRPVGARRGGAGHMVLVVDDDEHVRKVVVKQVRALGYEVTAARSAEEALSILASSHAIALLLTDVVLGSGMDGVALAIEAQRRFSNLEVLCMSGHAESDIFEGYDEAAHLSLLSKPFTKARLSERIQEALSGISGAELPPA